MAHLRRSPLRSDPNPRLFLFRGALSDAEIWGTPAQAGIWGRPEFSRGGTPAFVWPSDHTWCVAADVDPHWAGIGAAVPTIERLVADRRLDAVAADPDSEQPAYRQPPSAMVAACKELEVWSPAELDFHEQAALAPPPDPTRDTAPSIEDQQPAKVAA